MGNVRCLTYVYNYLHMLIDFLYKTFCATLTYEMEIVNTIYHHVILIIVDEYIPCEDETIIKDKCVWDLFKSTRMERKIIYASEAGHLNMVWYLYDVCYPINNKYIYDALRKYCTQGYIDVTDFYVMLLLKIIQQHNR